MSAIFRAEIANLQRIVAANEAMQQLDTNQRERLHTHRAEQDAIDRQAIIDTLAGAVRQMTSTEIATRAGVSRQRTEHILVQLVSDKIASRRRRATRRADGEGMRNTYKYSIAKGAQ